MNRVSFYHPGRVVTPAIPAPPVVTVQPVIPEATNKFLVAALDYAQQGIPVFPCRECDEGKYKTKAPYIAGGFKAASTDPAVIREWWRKWPRALIGSPTGKKSGFVVLDVDRKKGKDGYATLTNSHGVTVEELMRGQRCAKTPTGGAHFYFAEDPNFTTTTDTLGSGLDTRGEGGYIILPPSEIPGVGVYSWTDATSPLTPPWKWALKLLTNKGTKGKHETTTTAAAPVSAHNKVQAANVNGALAALDPSRLSYNDWVEVGMALHSWDPVNGLARWQKWSARDPRYRPGECDEKWKSFTTDGGTTISKLMEMATAAGWRATITAWYDSARKEYLERNERGAYLNLTESQFKQGLRARGFRTATGKGELVSPADAELLRIRDHYDVAYSGPLAGWPAGFHDVDHGRFVVTEGPRLITPAAGSWHTIEALMAGLFGLADGTPDQTPYVLSWAKVAIESLRAGIPRPGQALGLCGPRECGKSLLQQLITHALGGRVASPYQYMTGGTPFNADLFGAEHLPIDDESGSNDIRARRAFGQNLKQITAVIDQRCHRKGCTPVSLRPFWRLTISLNDEPENLMVLPPLDDSIQDKIMLLKCVKRPMPMPVRSLEDRRRFWETMTGELPAFIHFLLNEWTIPETIAGDRYGVTAYHHPDLVEALTSTSPEIRLLNLIRAAASSLISKGANEWVGSAEELEAHLLTPSYGLSRQAGHLFSWNCACGTYLGRLAARYPGIVQEKRSGSLRRWSIHL